VTRKGRHKSRRRISISTAAGPSAVRETDPKQVEESINGALVRTIRPSLHAKKPATSKAPGKLVARNKGDKGG